MKLFFKFLFCNELWFYRDLRNDINFNHAYGLRNENILRLPPARINRHKESVVFSAVKIWNDLPGHIQSSRQFNQFIGRLKSHLFVIAPTS